MNYLAAGDAIKTQLETLPMLRKVYVTENMDKLSDRQQVSPSAHVLLADDNPTNAQAGAFSKIKQTWLVVLCVRLGQDCTSTGELINTVLSSLMGHKANGLSPFNRERTNAKPSVSGGFAYYPFAFSTTFTLKGDTP